MTGASSASPVAMKSSYSIVPTLAAGRTFGIVDVDDQRLALSVLERLGDDRRELGVGEQHLCVAVVEHECDRRGVEADVHRIEHRARHRHAEGAFVGGGNVGRHQRDRVTAADAGLAQRRGELAAAAMHLGRRVASSIPASTRSTATSRPGTAIARADLRQPGHRQHDPPLHLSRAARRHGALRRRARGLGVGKGDRVIIYMPMVPEAAIAMLACARIGAVHSVVFGGFAANELAVRIDDCKPKAIVSASCGIEPNRVVEYKPLLDAAIAHRRAQAECLRRAAAPAASLQLIVGRDLDWEKAVARGEPRRACRSRRPIRSTSSTPPARPAQPKGVVRDNGGHAVALKYSMSVLYDMKPGEVYWAASDVGWVVGHSYIVYAPLLQGCTTVLYEGKPVGTPDAGAFWRVISQHKRERHVHRAHGVPRDQARGSRGQAGARLRPHASFRALFLAGERCDPDTLLWAQKILGVPVVDHWWQTETGWRSPATRSASSLFAVKPGSATKPMPGWDVQALGDDGHPVPAGRSARSAASCRCRRARCRRCGMPRSASSAPISRSSRLVQDRRRRDGRCRGLRHIMTRVDDVINVAGHRLSTGRWRRCSPRIPPSPNARWSAWGTSSRARCRSASSCSRTA
jgi:acyl-coenzyme A synthetase/AMP-(fatty) acid ligase